jgi:GAF domain-containing protein
MAMETSEIKSKIDRLHEKLSFVNDTWEKSGNRELLHLLIELGPKLFDCERVSIFAHNPTDNEVWLVWGTGVSEREIKVPKSNSLVGQVIHSGRSLTKTNMEHQSGAHEQVDSSTGFVSRNAMGSPIVSTDGKKVIGAMELLNKRNDEAFDDEDQSYLEKVTEYIGRYIESLYQRQELVKISKEIQVKISSLEKML